MKKKADKKASSAVRRPSPLMQEIAFKEVVTFIEASRIHASQAVNTVLIDLYWKVGEYVWLKIQNEGWGKGTVQALATFVQSKRPGIRGFSAQNIWRMRQFFDAYRAQPNLSTLLRELPWSSHLHIISRAKRLEEREFYLRMASKNCKAHENPSVGLLLCATKDSEVVEYCLSRSLSPAMISEYETMLPDKVLLKAKLHEFYLLCAPPAEDDEKPEPKTTKPARRRKQS